MLARLDRAALRWARTRGHTPALERAVGLLSRTGEHGAVWLAIGTAGTVLDDERRACWRRGTVTVAAAYALFSTVLLLVRRRRPDLPGLPPLAATPTQLAFPSAHATTSFAAARAYSRCDVPPVPLYALAVALAASRVYLGVHHPSDVLAGAALGSLLAR